MTPLRAVWFAVGLGAVLMAVLGVALPLLPTTPLCPSCGVRFRPVFGPRARLASSAPRVRANH